MAFEVSLMRPSPPTQVIRIWDPPSPLINEVVFEAMIRRYWRLNLCWEAQRDSICQQTGHGPNEASLVSFYSTRGPNFQMSPKFPREQSPTLQKAMSKSDTRHKEGLSVPDLLNGLLLLTLFPVQKINTLDSLVLPTQWDQLKRYEHWEALAVHCTHRQLLNDF